MRLPASDKHDESAPGTLEPADRLSVVTVTFNSSRVLAETLSALRDELRPGDEIIVVDNASQDGTPELVASCAPGAVVIRNLQNVGFAAGANIGAAHASGDLLLFLNPDAVPQPGFAEGIRQPVRSRRGWSAWMALVTIGGGGLINTSGGVVHFTGVAWAGQVGVPATRAPRHPREVAFASGACLVVPRDVWDHSGGFAERFFMYCEDVELSLRLRLWGGHVGLEPTAHVEHGYEFDKGPSKWRLLERNRWAMVIRIYPLALLLLVAPAMLATELAVVRTAIAGGWGRQKALAVADTVRALPRLIAERREIQRRRCVSSGEFAAWLTPDLSSPYLGSASRSRGLRCALRAYWSVTTALLHAGGSSR